MWMCSLRAGAAYRAASTALRLHSNRFLLSQQHVAVTNAPQPPNVFATPQPPVVAALTPRRGLATSSAAQSTDIRSEAHRGVYVEVHGGPTEWAQWKDFADADQQGDLIRTKCAAGGVVPRAMRLQKTTNASTPLVALEHAAAVYLRFLTLTTDVGVAVDDGTDATRSETDVNSTLATIDDEAFRTAAARYLRSLL